MKKDKLFFLIQSLLRYFPFKWALWLRSKLYPYFFKSFGHNVRIFDSVVIKYPSDISIGNNVTINQFCYIAGKGGLFIGNDVMIGSGTKMATSNHEFESTSIPMRIQGLRFDSIHIADDVWFGYNTVVLAGVSILKGSIIAAGSVVNKSTEEQFGIYGGVPAKLLKKR